MSNIKGVIFDRDNTLIFFDQNKIGALLMKISSIAPSFNPMELLGYWQTREKVFPKTVEEESEFWRNFWCVEVAKKYGLDEITSQRLFEELGPLYNTVFTAYPETLEVLNDLKANGMKLGILTNFELPSVHEPMINSGIDINLFEQNAILNATVLGVPKPHPDAYVIAARAIGLDPSEILFIDDKVENIEGAEKVGMRGILIDRENSFVDAQTSLEMVENSEKLIIRIESLLEIMNYIAK